MATHPIAPLDVLLGALPSLPRPILARLTAPAAIEPTNADLTSLLSLMARAHRPPPPASGAG